ncbi:hypothetical protein M2139_000304 [Enterococcus sp. PF1-24]|uniref:hypothetical protein n=1 Tax=unclassified Enterococcus TaxID=2608891 RepID=UPI0024762A85|nr:MULTISPECIES: hypothetical protein [unclassified Enterococcus]MDH6363276.1 hypothetical protein [Enterococcus sp. PFB1-1]MDH6400423.1 hypothetical protein [Enterococcus sp. PF1-24]
MNELQESIIRYAQSTNELMSDLLSSHDVLNRKELGMNGYTCKVILPKITEFLSDQAKLLDDFYVSFEEDVEGNHEK